MTTTKGPLRRVVQAGYHVAALTLTGTSPLLMNSGEADRDSDLYVAFRQAKAAKRKSVEEEARLREMEWRLGLYYDAQVGVYIPGKNVKELLRSAATKWYKGADIDRSLVIPDYRIPLIYEGPRDPAGLWKAGFRYQAMVANAGAAKGRVLRTRPCFDEWALAVELAYDPEDLDFEMLETVTNRSRKYGLGDYRPEFGSFEAELAFVREHRPDMNGSAVKRRDARQEEALRAAVERIVQPT